MPHTIGLDLHPEPVLRRPANGYDPIGLNTQSPRECLDDVEELIDSSLRMTARNKSPWSAMLRSPTNAPHEAGSSTGQKLPDMCGWKKTPRLPIGACQPRATHRAHSASSSFPLRCRSAKLAFDPLEHIGGDRGAPSQHSDRVATCESTNDSICCTFGREHRLPQG